MTSDNVVNSSFTSFGSEGLKRTVESNSQLRSLVDVRGRGKVVDVSWCWSGNLQVCLSKRDGVRHGGAVDKSTVLVVQYSL